jgi:hypothetical protein
MPRRVIVHYVQIPDAMQQFQFSDMLVQDYSRLAEGNVNNRLDALSLLEPARHLAVGPVDNMTVSWRGGFAGDQVAEPGVFG